MPFFLNYFIIFYSCQYGTARTKSTPRSPLTTCRTSIEPPRRTHDAQKSARLSDATAAQRRSMKQLHSTHSCRCTAAHSLRQLDEPWFHRERESSRTCGSEHSHDVVDATTCTRRLLDTCPQGDCIAVGGGHVAARVMHTWSERGNYARSSAL